MFDRLRGRANPKQDVNQYDTFPRAINASHWRRSGFSGYEADDGPDSQPKAETEDFDGVSYGRAYGSDVRPGDLQPDKGNRLPRGDLMAWPGARAALPENATVSRDYTDREIPEATDVTWGYPDRKISKATGVSREYPDREIPEAIDVIREYPDRKISKTTEVSREYPDYEIPEATDVKWGYPDEIPEATDVSRGYPDRRIPEATTTSRGYSDSRLPETTTLSSRKGHTQPDQGRSSAPPAGREHDGVPIYLRREARQSPTAEAASLAAASAAVVSKLKNGDINRLMNENIEMKRTISRLEERCLVAENEYQGTNDLLQSERERFRIELQAEKKATNDERLIQERARHADTQNRLEALNQVVEKLHEEAVEREEDLEDFKGHMSAKNNEMKKMETAASSAANSLAEMKEEIKKKNDEIRELKLDDEKKKQVLRGAFDAEIQELKSDVRKRGELLEAAQRQLEAKIAELKDLETTKNQEIETIATRIQNIQEYYVNQVGSRDEEIKKLRGVITAMKSLLEDF